MSTHQVWAQHPDGTLIQNPDHGSFVPLHGDCQITPEDTFHQGQIERDLSQPTALAGPVSHTFGDTQGGIMGSYNQFHAELTAPTLTQPQLAAELTLADLVPCMSLLSPNWQLDHNPFAAQSAGDPIDLPKFGISINCLDSTALLSMNTCKEPLAALSAGALTMGTVSFDTAPPYNGSQFPHSDCRVPDFDWSMSMLSPDRQPDLIPFVAQLTEDPTSPAHWAVPVNYPGSIGECAPITYPQPLATPPDALRAYSVQPHGDESPNPDRHERFDASPVTAMTMEMVTFDNPQATSYRVGTTLPIPGVGCREPYSSSRVKGGIRLRRVFARALRATFLAADVYVHRSCILAFSHPSHTFLEHMSACAEYLDDTQGFHLRHPQGGAKWVFYCKTGGQSSKMELVSAAVISEKWPDREHWAQRHARGGPQYTAEEKAIADVKLAESRHMSERTARRRAQQAVDEWRDRQAYYERKTVMSHLYTNGH